METPNPEKKISFEASPEPEMPKNDVLFVEVPAGGFDLTAIQKYIRGGYSLWGVIPVSVKSPLEGVPPAETYYLVLKLEVNAIPVNLLAHHIVKAKQEKGGLDQIAQTFFALSLGQLEKGLQEARDKANDRR